MDKWIEGLPDIPGFYWLYSYRYGKNENSMHGPNDPELILIEVVEIANGVLIIGDGQFVSKTEVEQPHYQPAVLPTLPELK